jgi:hypothetical protein
VWQGGEERPASSLLRPGLILRPHYQDGSEAGDAAYADNVNPGEELMLGPGKFVRVLEFVPVDEDGSPYAGLLMAELVDAGG